MRTKPRPYLRTAFAAGTWIESEDAAGPHAKMARHGVALVRDEKEEKLRPIRAGIPDTFVSIPARARRNWLVGTSPTGPVYEEIAVKGYVFLDDGALVFQPDETPLRCIYHPDNLNNPDNYTANGRLKKDRRHLKERT